MQKKIRINNKVIKDGWIAVSYKHYLALEDIVKNKYSHAIIMEDNVGHIKGNIYKKNRTNIITNFLMIGILYLNQIKNI